MLKYFFVPTYTESLNKDAFVQAQTYDYLYKRHQQS